MPVTVDIDLSNVLGRDGMVARHGRRRVEDVVSRAQAATPVDTGRLRSSPEIHHPEALRWLIIYPLPYARWIHEGDRFHPQAGRIVFVKAGPRPYLRDAGRMF